MDIFKFYPKITYENSLSRNIMSRASLVKGVLKSYEIYYPYEVKDWERPDTIAYDYYGNSDYEWLVCLPNNIIDIPSDWVKDYKAFYQYMRTTYGDVESTKNIIHHYKYTGIGGETDAEIARKSWPLTPRSFAALTTQDKSGWSPVYLYDYESELNEAKRNIRLISNVYLSQIDREIQELFQ